MEGIQGNVFQNVSIPEHTTNFTHLHHLYPRNLQCGATNCECDMYWKNGSMVLHLENDFCASVVGNACLNLHFVLTNHDKPTQIIFILIRILFCFYIYLADLLKPPGGWAGDFYYYNYI